MLPALGVEGEIPLLVDTGADTTTIHWADRQLLATPGGRRLSADTAFLEHARASGIADTLVDYGREDAVLAFRTEEGSVVVTDLSVHIQLNPDTTDVPSLLGRDVLSEARLDFNMPADELVLDWVLG